MAPYDSKPSVDDLGLLVHWQQGLTHYHDKQYLQALDEFEKLEPLLDRWAQDANLRLLGALVANHAFLSAYESSRYERALHHATREYEFGGDSPAVRARALNNKGLALIELGDLVSARTCFIEAMGCLDRSPPEGRTPVFDSERLRTLLQRHLGFVEGAQNEHGTATSPGAARSMRQSWVPNRAQLDAADIVYVAVVSSTDAARHGDVALAVTIAARAVDALQAGGDKKSLGIALSNLGFCRLQASDLSGAESAFEESSTLLEALPRPNEPLARTLFNFSEVRERQGRRLDALELSRRAWHEIRKVAPETPQALQILRQLALRRFVTGDLAKARAALYHAMKTYDASRHRFGLSEEEHSGTFATYRHIVEVMLIIAVHEGLPDEAMTLIEAAKARFWSEHVAKLTPAARPAMQAASTADGRPDSQTMVSVGEGISDPGCLFINFFTGPNYSFVATSHNGRVAARRIALTESELTERVRELWEDLQTPDAPVTWRKGARELKALLLDDLDKGLGDLRQIQIAPDGPLWMVPFDLLLGVDLALETLDVFAKSPVAYIPRAGLAANYRSSPRALLPEEVDVAVIARSEFNTELPPLTAVVAEVNVIKRVTQSHAKILDERSATRESTVNVLQSADIIHIATHALGDLDETRSAIVLSDGKGGDDMLLAPDIGRLRLKAEVVFLSACSSAIGRVSQGEGLMSIARAFLLAGCRSVIAALWPVDDDEAATFVRMFYENYFISREPADALRQTKGGVLDMGLSLYTTAAFQLYGGILRSLSVRDVSKLLIADADGDTPRTVHDS